MNGKPVERSIVITFSQNFRNTMTDDNKKGHHPENEDNSIHLVHIEPSPEEPLYKVLIVKAGDNPIAALCALAMLFLLSMMVLAAIFPSIFESAGITALHNKQTGIFAECWFPPGEDTPICRGDKNYKNKKIAKPKGKRIPRELLPSRSEKPGYFGKVRIVPFSLSE